MNKFSEYVLQGSSKTAGVNGATSGGNFRNNCIEAFHLCGVPDAKMRYGAKALKHVDFQTTPNTLVIDGTFGVVFATSLKERLIQKDWMVQQYEKDPTERPVIPYWTLLCLRENEKQSSAETCEFVMSRQAYVKSGLQIVTVVNDFAVRKYVNTILRQLGRELI